ncbi:MAG TPA: penicillin acylase family protein [Candidatus Angelobacter sp.]|nr:penicillin acylase family protein [Candidatus Angelobacter sp.]
MASTLTAPAPRRSAARRILKVISFLLTLLVAGIILLVVWFRHTALASLAQIDGTVTVSGLQAPVQVVRDAHGVPHLKAQSLQDLFFAQGYVTAQDRLWQMDLTRRAVAGEMAEVFPGGPAPARPSRASGPPSPIVTWVDYDKQQRILRLRSVADRVAAQLSPRDRSFFDAYAAGVNAYIIRHENNLPIEFHVLNYAPRPWTVSDSVLVGIGMSQLLNPQYEMEYRREKMAEILSPELMADLYPTGSWRDHAPADDSGEAENKTARKQNQRNLKRGSGALTCTSAACLKLQTALALRAAASLCLLPPSNPICEACLPGSNDWVVSGAHTVSGKPLLSNDMHLPHRVPGVWYEAHLESGNFNVEGFTLPGVPFVIVGHNQRIAWGFTNLNPDVQDLFVENFNSQGEYQTPTGWQQPERVHEVIHVKGKSDVHFDVVITRHGPIISSLFPGETRHIALQWVLYDTRQISIPLFDLDSAQNWDQFRKALSSFATPSQNVVYGDVDGNIGYQPMGFVPTRASGDGTVPVSGADGKHDWTGYLPFDKLPDVYNPPNGIIATANSKITPKGYPYLLATQWFPPYRTQRIYHVLEQDKKLSPADMLALQTDITSDYDRFFADRFVYAIDHSGKATNRTRQAADIMRGFDGQMVMDSAAPTIEVKARVALWKLLLQPKLGENWDRYEWSLQSVALENIVQNKPNRWLPPGYSSFNDLLNAAVAKATEHAPRDLKSWKYGDEYPVVINHPIFGAIPILGPMAGPGRHPQSGGGFTVKQVGRTFGPSERMTVNFSNLDASTFNVVQGESGQIFSPYYMDHWPAWYYGTTFTLAYSDSAVNQSRTHELTLKPGE